MFVEVPTELIAPFVDAGRQLASILEARPEAAIRAHVSPPFIDECQELEQLGVRRRPPNRGDDVDRLATIAVESNRLCARREDERDRIVALARRGKLTTTRPGGFVLPPCYPGRTSATPGRHIER